MLGTLNFTENSGPPYSTALDQVGQINPFAPKLPEILLSVHAQTLQAYILDLDQKAAKCMTCKRLCSKFYLPIAGQRLENQTHF